MLVVHHIIDALRGATRKHEVMRLGVPPERRTAMAALLEDAEKFDFGTLTFERDAELGHWLLQKITQDERQFWREGLIPLPAPVCWYEFTLGESRSGVLVSEQGDDFWKVSRVDFTRPIVYDGLVCSVSKAECAQRNELVGHVSGNDSFMAQMQANEYFMKNNVWANIPLAIYLTLMLNSKTTEMRSEIPPPRLNKARQAKGRAPLATHHIVDIVPARYREDAEREGHANRKPPRLHWRRSHKRHYDHHVLSARWASSEVYGGRAGWWVAIIPRFLVGRAELGEVSHEYRVHMTPAQEAA